jgi:uncharacterized membrane protein
MNDFLQNHAWIHEVGIDVVAIIVSLLLIGSYYLNLYIRIRRDPSYSIHRVNALARALWVKSLMDSPGKEIIAVQSLRNFIMVGIMMATTSSLLIMGTLTLSGQAENITHTWHAINFGGSHLKALWIIKVLCLLADFIIAFFAFVMSMRFANQVLFMINVPAESREGNPALSPENVANRMNRAGHMVSIGVRAFFFAIPLVFWLFGPLFLVFASIGLVVTLHHLDTYNVD